MPNDISHEIVQLKGNYNCEKITEELELAKEELSDLVNVELWNNSIDTALDILDTRIREIHKRNKNKRVEIRHKSDRMEDANKAFDHYMNALDDPTSTEPILNEKFERYMLARKALNTHAISEETRNWNNVIKESDNKSFWTYVDWKGNVGKKKNTTAPTLNEFEIFFQELYKCNNNRVARNNEHPIRREYTNSR